MNAKLSLDNRDSLKQIDFDANIGEPKQTENQNG